MLNVYKLKYCARLLNDVYREIVLLQTCLFHYTKKSRLQIHMTLWLHKAVFNA